MNRLLVAGVLLASAVASAQETKPVSPGKMHHRHLSQLSKNHHSGASTTELNATGAPAKSLQGDLHKIETESLKRQGPVAKNKATRVNTAYAKPKQSTDKNAPINFQYQGPRTTMTTSKAAPVRRARVNTNKKFR